jgi:hypothetical protein
LPGKGGIQVTIIFPTLSTILYNIEIEEAATREEIMTLMSRMTKLPIIHEESVEMGPLDWFDKERLTIQYQYPRLSVDAIDTVSRQTLLENFNPTVPVLIETDGACSGNPGPGGWGAII